ncbi:hypothetical protein [Metamycoplasma canadense]|uniref:hypothetical protein n=1 Tax=Metamycoplasma canadense TaxID=29554 RepID=UPI0005EE3C64|nr:hypothetical protein [Metamycoplasma canadense]
MSAFINLGTIKFKTLTSKITALGQERLSGFGFFWKNKWNKNNYLNCYCFNSKINEIIKKIYQKSLNLEAEIDVIVWGDISINYDPTNGHCYPSLYIEKIMPLNNLLWWNKG